MNDDNIIRLSLGERLTIRDSFESAEILEGDCELYAVTTDVNEHRQIFLLEKTAGDIIFPAFSRQKQVEYFLYSLGDVVLKKRALADYSLDVLQPAAGKWFSDLSRLGWFQQLLTGEDKILGEWLEKASGTASGSVEELAVSIRDNANKVAVLVALYFAAKGRQLTEQIAAHQIYKQEALQKAIRTLVQQEEAATEMGEAASISDIISDHSSVASVVRAVARHLKQPEGKISIPKEGTKKYTQDEVLKRLIFKGNMEMRRVELKGEWYRHDCGTMIGWYGDSKELAAVLPVDENSYKIISRSFPDGEIIDEEIAEKLGNTACLCYACFPARRLTVKDMLLFMFNRCWKRDYLMILVLSVIGGIIPLVTPVITQTVFQDIIPIMDRQSLAAVTQIMVISGFAVASLGMVRSVAVLRITNHIDMSVEAALWSRLLHLPANFFRKYQSGELLSRMNGIETLKGLVSGDFVATVFNLIFSFWSVILMFWYSAKLTFEALLVWIIYCLVVALIYRQRLSFQRSIIDVSNKTAGIIQQIFSGLPKFRIHGAEEQAYFLWAKIFGLSWHWKLKVTWQTNYTAMLLSIQPFVLNMLLYYTAVYGLTETDAAGHVIKSMSYAEFLAFSAAYSSFNATVNGFIPLVANFFMIKPQIDNFKPILEEEPEYTEDKKEAGELTGNLEVSHLTFAYGEKLPLVLDDISFKVTPGEKLAIVGRSGCGKSTLLRLLLGMEKPRSGAIYYDGLDLSSLMLSSVRSQLGVVLQNGQLMTGDIFSNIVGATALTMDDAWEAAEKTGIADDIREMPMGMHTVISEGSSNISGGQRQRLMIARAIVGRPAIIMLDEATSALDNRTQAIVTESLDKMNSTMIIVAHRLSTIRGATRIIVLDGGKIAEEGTYDELMDKGGIFATMANRQIA